jgi:endo-1,4-beta-xylanase
VKNEQWEEGMRLSVFFMTVLLLLPGISANAKAIRDEAAASGSQKPGSQEPVLKDQYKAFFPVGNVVSPRDLGGPRFELLKKHFDILTAENAMKPLYLQGQKGVFTFETADRLVDAVLAGGMKMHGHTLAWHQQSPEWINRDGISRDEADENLITHVTTVADHFKGRVISWDVLNEVFIDNPPNPNDWKGSLRQTPWLRAIGPEYVEIAFKAAREADPDAVLYYNDYNMDNRNKALAVYTMVRDLNERYPDVLGRPLVDAVGMQGHYRVNMNPENAAASLRSFISLGVEVSITELDVQAGTGHSLTEAQSLQQGLMYARLFAFFREYAAHMGRVTIWGLDDGSSWRAQTSPTLFDKDLRPKPAFFGALNPSAYVGENENLLSIIKKQPLQADARFGSPGLDPKDPLWETAPSIPINQNVMAWQGASGSARALWDDTYLYVRITVNNAELNKIHPAPYEQDSVEIFIDEGNHKASYMQSDDGQYRVNFENEQSFSPPTLAEGFESAAVAADRSYTVTVKIPFRTVTPKENLIIGFELQINGAGARGGRESVTTWNDNSGEAWQDPSLYGLLRLSGNSR